MTCNQTYKLFDSIMDDEATDSERKYFFKHLEKCLECLNHYELDRLFKEFVQEKQKRINCPPSVLEAIKTQINNLSA